MAGRAPAYVANLIPQLQDQFSSATEALEYLKSQGMGMRRQNFLQLWGATIKEQSLRERLQSVPLERTPNADEIVQAPRPNARGYLYTFDVLVKDPLTGLFHFTPTGYRTDEPVTFAEAAQGATDALVSAQNRDSPLAALGSINGVSLVSVLQFVPQTDEPTEYADTTGGL